MKTLSIRELRNRPGAAQKELGRDREVVLTANGRPVALMLSVQEDDLGEMLESWHLARGQMALRVLRREAHERGLSRLTINDINKLIGETRQHQAD